MSKFADEHGFSFVKNVQELVELLAANECVYLHDETEKAVAIVLPIPGWWYENLPEAPLEHFGHDHVTWVE